MLRPHFILLLMAVAASAEPLRIDVEGDWGKAALQDIHAVLLSAGGELWRQCPHTQLDAILVRPRDGTPQTDWERSADGRIAIGLSAREMFWAQYAYQFSHEFCHTLAMQSNDWRKAWRGDGKPNHWLEECLCETASLYTLRAMGKSWAIDPPYANWKDFAPALTDYARERIEDPKHQLPPDTGFLAWFRAEEPGLRKNPAQREKNTIIAKQLLPLFETEPRGWETVTYFNLGTRDRKMPLATFLAAWRDRCPSEHQSFVRKLAALFDVQLDPKDM